MSSVESIVRLGRISVEERKRKRKHRLWYLMFLTMWNFMLYCKIFVDFIFYQQRLNRLYGHYAT